jgi:predicted GNAT family acetyltransferase
MRGEPVQTTLTEDLGQFTRTAGDWLAASPAENNVLLSAIATQRAGQAKGDRPATFGWVTDGGEVLGALRWPPPLPATMTAMPAVAAEALATELAARGVPLPGVNGPKDAVSAFAARWQELTGQATPSVRSLVLSSTSKVTLSQWPPGGLRPARPAEASLLTGWIAKVFADAGLPAADESARQQIEEQLAGDRLYVWEDGGEPVAVTGHAAPVSGVALIHGGFTPPERRTSWYGAAVVAGVTVHLLENGCTACIGIGDHANRYVAAGLRMIGYSPLVELSEHRFQTGPEPASPLP